jgi:hypothetical protein
MELYILQKPKRTKMVEQMSTPINDNYPLYVSMNEFELTLVFLPMISRTPNNDCHDYRALYGNNIIPGSRSTYPLPGRQPTVR